MDPTTNNTHRHEHSQSHSHAPSPVTPASTALTPQAEYQARLSARQQVQKRHEQLQEVIANARLLVFGLGLLAAWAVFGGPGISWLWLLGVIGLFLGLVLWNERINRNAARASRAVAFYQRGIDRLDDKWVSQGEMGARFLDPEHPFAADLDLFGPGSLYQLLCTARTRAGEDTLARWLLAPAPREEILARQQAITELRTMLDWREELALRGADVQAGINPDTLVSWACGPAVLLTKPGLRPMAAVLSLISCITIALWGVGATNTTPMFIAILVLIGVYMYYRKPMRDVVDAVEQHAHDLILLSELLEQLEAQSFQSPRLQRLQSSLKVDGQPPSVQIRHLGRLVYLLTTMRNQFFAPIGGALLWPLQLALSIDAWRSRSGPKVKAWLDAVGELEALCSLSSFSYENPGDPFPTLVEGVAWEGQKVQHPMLIPKSHAVANDVRFDDTMRVYIVSGSNMSGKSTLLRSVGVNTVLALAGGTVRAKSLTLSPLALGATLRVQDSLQAGKSRFYAEITRVRQLVDISKGDLPLLFLLDEVFSGTNSHERCIGAEAIVRGLIERGAIGLVTTHDLTLADIGNRLAPRACKSPLGSPAEINT